MHRSHSATTLVRRAIAPRPTPTVISALASVESLERRSLLSVVLPGGAVALAGTTAAARPELAGTVIRDATIPFSVSDGIGHTIFKGTLQDRVVRETKAGTLDFYQTIRADPGFTVPGILDSVVRSNFAGVSTDADYRTDGLGEVDIKPERATRSSDGKSVSFAFGADHVDPGENSRLYFIKTDAKGFDVKGSTAVNLGRGPTPGSGNGSVKLTTAEPVAAPPTGAISGVKFNDLNGNGVRDRSDPVLGGWTIYLDANNNKKLDPGEKQTTTNANGFYSFTGLAAGKYNVREVVQRGWRQTAPSAGVYSFTLAAGTTAINRNFGNTQSVLIVGQVQLFSGAGLAGARVYLDANNNKKFDLGEKFVITPTSGKFQFAGLAANPVGTVPYRVRALPPNLYAIISPTSGLFSVNLNSGGVSSLLTFKALEIPQ